MHMMARFNLQPGDKVLDIASNDGVLLRHFKDLGMSILGIDPAQNIAIEANKNGIPTIAHFFTEECADKILRYRGKFKLITANNIFAHLPDLADFARGVKKILAPGGVFSFEVSYFNDVCEKTLFDTIYHEHSSYHTVKPLIKFFDDLDMTLFEVEKISNHGGSIRVFVCHQADQTSWRNLHNVLAGEDNIAQKVIRLQKDIKLLGYELREKLQHIKSQGKSIAIYGVPAKATTLMYALGIDENIIDFAVDDAPLKQGTFTPGKHIPVFSTQAIYDKKPDCLLILAWNFAPSIMQKHSNFQGKWIVPIPELKEY
jgi:SAM-dependent methyltransferase